MTEATRKITTLAGGSGFPLDPTETAMIRCRHVDRGACCPRPADRIGGNSVDAPVVLPAAPAGRGTRAAVFGDDSQRIRTVPRRAGDGAAAAPGPWLLRHAGPDRSQTERPAVGPVRGETRPIHRPFLSSPPRRRLED